MELVVLEAALGFDVAGAVFDYGQDAVVDVPGDGRFVAVFYPFVGVFAVEEDDGVGGGNAVGCAGCDYGRNGLPDFGFFGFGLVGLGKGRRRCEKREEKEPEISHCFHRAECTIYDLLRKEARFGAGDKGAGVALAGQEMVAVADYQVVHRVAEFLRDFEEEVDQGAVAGEFGGDF